ncbi:MAG: transglutaminase-like domain-containing protein [Bacteroidota bacterium]
MKLLSKLLVAFLVGCFIPHSAYCQKISPEDLETAKQLKELKKEEDLALTEAITSYEFMRSPDGQKIRVKESITERFIALTTGVNHIKRLYYNDQTRIESYSIKNSRNKAIKHDKFCGHIRSDDIFYSDARVCAYNMNFNLEGQVINFDAQLIYDDARYLTKTFLLNEVFSKQQVIQFKIPSWLDVELKVINFENFDIQKNEQTTSEGRLVTYTILNAEKLPGEKNMPGYLHFIPHILILTKSQQLNGQSVPILSSTKDLYKWYASLISGMNNDPTKLKSTVEKILGGENLSELEKISRLYYWVQDNIRYIAFEDGIAGFQPENAQKVLDDRYGDCKGMANLLKEMLIIAGFDARLTWIGTNRIPYDYSIPSLAVDNHMICSVMAGDSLLILDATERFQSVSGNGERIQGRPILIEDEDSFMLKEVPMETASSNLEANTTAFKIEDNVLVGEGTKKLYGEKKKMIRHITETINSDKVDLFLSYVVSQGKTNEYELINQPQFDRDQPTELQYKASLTNKVQSFNDKIYIDLDFSKDFYKSSIEEDRFSPFDFHGRTHISSEIALSLPTAATIDFIPSPLQISNDWFDVDIRYEKSEGKVLYKKQIKILKSILPVAQFEEWNNMIKKLDEFYSNQLILTYNK